MAIGYKAAVAAMRAGDILMVTHPSPNKANDAAAYELVKCGKRVGVRAYRKMLDNLRPRNDGPFGCDMSQTFEWFEDGSN